MTWPTRAKEAQFPQKDALRASLEFPPNLSHSPRFLEMAPHSLFLQEVHLHSLHLQELAQAQETPAAQEQLGSIATRGETRVPKREKKRQWCTWKAESSFSFFFF